MDIKKEIECKTSYTGVALLHEMYWSMLPKDVDMTHIRELYGAISPEGYSVILGEYRKESYGKTYYHAITQLVVTEYDKDGNVETPHTGNADATYGYDWHDVLTLVDDY